MMTLLVTHAYRIAMVLAVLGLISAVFLFKDLAIPYWTDLFPPPLGDPQVGEGDESTPVVSVIQAFGAIVGSFGTVFMMLIGWRKERRDVAESKLKIMKLELELARMTAASGPNAKP